MDHTHDQLWGEALRRLGVKNPGALELRDPAQLVVLLADTSHLAVPAATPIYGGRVAVAAGGAGTFGTIELCCRAAGTYVLAILMDPANDFRLYTLGAPTGLGGFPATAARYTAFGDGRDGQNWIHRGTPAAIGAGVDMLYLNVTGSGALGGPGEQYNFPEPMFMAQNRVLGVQITVANTLASMGIIWREIQVGGP